MSFELTGLKQRFDEGEINISDFLPSSIKDSWLRCKNNSLDMKGELQYERPRKAHLEELQYDSRTLLSSSKDHLQRLHESVSNAGWSILLTNPNCHTLQVMRSNKIVNERLFSAFECGVLLNEHSVGTTAMSCSIYSKKFTRVFGSEHYKDLLNGLNCAAMPVLNHKGIAIGSINVSNENPFNDPSVFFMLKTCAKDIQKQLICSMPNSIVVELTLSSGQFGALSNLIISVDLDGRIIGCNETARRFLFNDLAINGQKFHAVFNSSFSDVLHFGISKQQVFLLKTKAGVVFTAKVIQEHTQHRKLFNTTNPLPIKEKVKQVQPNTVYFGDRNISKNIALGKKVIHRLPIILLGESGAGKEVSAQHLHDSSQCSGKFISINCAAIPETLIESELFGYQGGAFTGADKKGYKGRIAEAHNGTLFLDEIGDMPLMMQSRMLRILETRKINPLGSSIEKNINFQLICATNIDLEKLVESGGFRKDLYYRIKGYAINLLPLRLREDKIGIADIILQKNCVNKSKLSDEVKHLIENYNWPGNIRELRNVFLYADTINHGDETITLQELPEEYHQIVNELPHQTLDTQDNKIVGKVDVEMQKLIIKALAECKGNVSEAAKWLGISRATLYRKLPTNFVKSVSS